MAWPEFLITSETQPFRQSCLVLSIPLLSLELLRISWQGPTEAFGNMPCDGAYAASPIAVVPWNNASSNSECFKPFSQNLAASGTVCIGVILKLVVYVTICHSNKYMKKLLAIRTCMYSFHHSSLATIVLLT